MAKQIKSEQIIHIRLKNLEAFRRYQKIKAASKAIELKLEQLANEAGLPKSKRFKRNCKGYLVDGNGGAVAKFSVYDMPEKTVPGFKVCRIS